MRKQWDFVNEKVLLEWDQQCQLDLLWWDQDRLQEGVHLQSFPPDLYFWSDALEQGWGAFLGPEGISGLWSREEQLFSINRRELRAILLGLQSF